MKRNQNFDHNHSQKVFSCRYNMDINRVEARFEDGTILSIDCIVIEDEYGNTPAQRAELDWLLTAGVLPPFATFLKSVSIWDTPSTSRPESTSRTRKAIMSRRTNGQFSRIPMSLSLTSRPLTLCRKSEGMSDATRTAGAKQLPSRVCSIAPIAAARCKPVLVPQGTVQRQSHKLAIIVVDNGDRIFKRIACADGAAHSLLQSLQFVIDLDLLRILSRCNFQH